MNIKQKNDKIKKDFFQTIKNIPALRILARLWMHNQNSDSPIKVYEDWDKSLLSKDKLISHCQGTAFVTTLWAISFAFLVSPTSNPQICHNVIVALSGFTIYTIIGFVVACMMPDCSTWEIFSEYLLKFHSVLPFYSFVSQEEFERETSDLLISIAKEISIHEAAKQYSKAEAWRNKFKVAHGTFSHFGLVNLDWTVYFTKAAELVN